MIPKVIHYCWFGRNPLPVSALKCIESWKRHLPDFEIKEWNEENFDVNAIPYTRDAYQEKKYAFVSDYARFWILYNFGGIYFDTDVEVIRPMDAIITNGPFMGAEVDGNERDEIFPKVAPGLCIGAYSKMRLLGEVIKRYKVLNFYGPDGTLNKYTMIPLISNLLKEAGMVASNKIQTVSDFTIYPSEYFNPLEIATGRLKMTSNTYSIHWFMASWLPYQPKWRKKTKQYIRRFLSIFK